MNQPLAILPYESCAFRAKLAFVCLWTYLATGVCSIFIDIYMFYLLVTPDAAFYIEQLDYSYGPLTAFDITQLIYYSIKILAILCVLLTTVFFCMWIHRAYRNLPSLGARNLKYSPGWAVGWFFIPFANLYLPLVVVREIWQGSDPENDVSKEMKNIALNKNTLPSQWWLMFYVAGISADIAGNAMDRASTLAGYRVAEFFSLIDDFTAIPLAAVTILLIKGIVDRQQRRATVLGIDNPDAQQQWEEMQPRDENWEDYLDRNSTSI